jgi:non-specific protein-tyrosine kinase
VDLRDYVRLLRRRWRLIALCALLGLGAASAVTYTATPIYTASTRLFVSATDASSEDTGSAYTGSLFTQQRVKSYTQVVASPQVAERVREELRLDVPAEALAAQISASAPLDTVLLNVSVRDASPQRAQAIAASIGRVFPAFVNDIERPQAGGTSPVRVSVVQEPGLPVTPTSPRTQINLLLGLLVGLAVGAGAAVLRETLDTSIKSPDDAAAVLGAPVLGTIAQDPEATKKPLIVHLSPRSPRAEAFRTLRTNLQFVDVDKPLRSVVITSSLPAEGKSVTSCNLAISIAQAGIPVVLIEGDLRRPRVAEYLGIEGSVGLTSVLLGQVSLEDALQPWGDGHLRVLASGPLPPNPSELLGSSQMERLLKELEAHAKTVIIDAPPLLPVTDAAVLGARCSGVLMVVKSNHTKHDELVRATEHLQSVGANVVGGVLNMVPTRGPDAYHYGYGYYSDDKDGQRGRRGTTGSMEAPAQEPAYGAPSPLTPAPAAAAPELSTVDRPAELATAGHDVDRDRVQQLAGGYAELHERPLDPDASRSSGPIPTTTSSETGQIRPPIAGEWTRDASEAAADR